MAFFLHQIEHRGAMMIDSRGFSSPSQADSRPDASAGRFRTRMLDQDHQDHQGPLDGELLDLYIAILIVVPAACFLRSLLF